MRTSIISGIILIIIGGIASKYFFGEKAELKFLLSDRIPTSFLESNDEETSIQQLELINTGEVELDRIIIKVKSQVLEYDIRKIATNDSIDISQNKNLLEIIYPKIPLEAKIGIILKTTGRGITSNDLEISHSKGRARQVAESPIFFSYLYYGLVLLYLILTINSLRSSYLDSFSRKVYYSAYDDILNKPKPWYIPRNKWKDLRKDAIDHCFDKDYSTNIINSLSYQILNLPIPQDIKADEWNKLKLQAQDKLLSKISETIYRGISWNTEQLINMVKPKNIDEDSWLKIIELISKGFVVQRILRISDYNSEKDIEERLAEQKPSLIREVDWKEYVDFLEKFKKLINLQKRNQAYKVNWENILFGNKVEASDSLSNEEFEKFKHIQQRIFEESKKINDKLVEISQRENKLIPLEIKLEKQLEIIHQVLNDHTILERIEDYSNPFSPGNFENLKKIAQIHAKFTKTRK